MQEWRVLNLSIQRVRKKLIILKLWKKKTGIYQIKVEVAQQKIDAIKAAYEQKIQDIEQEKSKLTSLLAEAQEKINELETAPTTFKSDDEAYLAQFDDTDISVLPSIDSDEILSLCEVISDYNDQKWLIRYADLSHDGSLPYFFEA